MAVMCELQPKSNIHFFCLGKLFAQNAFSSKANDDLNMRDSKGFLRCTLNCAKEEPAECVHSVYLFVLAEDNVKMTRNLSFLLRPLSVNDNGNLPDDYGDLRRVVLLADEDIQLVE